jgi:hypothetical protein
MLFAAILTAAPALHACSVCWGNPDDPLVKGANAGIWVLLSIVGAVQIGFIALFWSFWRRAREQQRFRASLRVVHPFDPVEPSMQPSPIPGGGQKS